MRKYPLMLVEWEDSARAVPDWTFLDDIEPDRGPLVIQSAGFLIWRTEHAVLLVQNLSTCAGRTPQACHGITIPARAILRQTVLDG